jgi:tetratricopeptide (TPR) repeat protein
MLRMLIVAVLGLSLLEVAFADEPKPQWQRMLTGDDAKKADELQKRIAELEAADKYAAAIQPREELLALRKKLQGDDHWETLIEKWTLVALKKVAALPEEKRSVWRKTLHGANEAGLLEQKAQHFKALPLRQECLKWALEFLGEADPVTAAGYNNLARNLNFQGRYAEAGPLCQKALDIYRQTLGERHPYTGLGYNNLALNLNAQGRYAEAEPLLQKGLEIYREALGEEHPNTGAGFHNLAINLDAQGKYAEAGALFQRALDTIRRVGGEEHPDTAGIYNDVAINLQSQGRFTEAEPLHQKALQIFRKVRGEEHPDTGKSYLNGAVNLQAQRKYAEAGPLCQKALIILRQSLGEEHLATSAAYNNLALNLQLQGNYAEAGPLYQKALTTSRKVLGEGHPQTANIYSYVALNLYAQAKYPAALESLEAAVRAFEAARQYVAVGGLERATFRVERSPHAMLAAAKTGAGRSAEAWSAMEAGLARGLLEEMASRLGSGFTPDELRRRNEFRVLVTRINARILALVGRPKRTNSESAELEGLIEQRKKLEESLIELAVAASRREVATLAQLQAALPSDVAFVAWVDESEQSRGMQEHWGCVVRSTGDPKWERLPGSGTESKWTTEDTELPERFREALIKKDPASRLDALAEKFHAQRLAPLIKHLAGVKRLFVAPVNQMAGIPIEALTDQYTISYTPSGTYLARLKDLERPHVTGVLAVGDPLLLPAKEVAKPTSLPPGGLLITQVVPNGNAAKARLQGGDVLVSYAGTNLTSVEQLGKLIDGQAAAKSVVVEVWREGQEKLNEREVAPGKLGVVVAKEPAREAITARRQTDQMLAKLSRGEDFAELPGTQVEISRLAGLFDGKNVTTLTRGDATEERLEAMRKADELKKFRYLHFATHGKANNFRSFDSALILTRPDKIPEPRAGEPWLDGRQTAAEVLEYWKLDAELVTLSACESALGRQGGGDGLLGFAQAFLLAGSRSVCLTLWQVDDTATVLLMDRFYRDMLGKRDDKAKPMGKAAALHEAKHWLRDLTATEALERLGTLTNGVVRGERPAREEMKTIPMPKDAGKDYKPYSHPRYWAAFILIGDPE